MAEIKMEGNGDIIEIANHLANEIENSGLSCNLLSKISHSYSSCIICTMVFEKYFMRASNRVSLTVVLSGENGKVYADIIGSGGGNGPIFKFSFGAEESFENDAVNILKRLGLR